MIVPDQVQIRCPRCGRFLTETIDFARTVCPECGSEVQYKSKLQRRIERERAVLMPPETRIYGGTTS